MLGVGVTAVMVVMECLAVGLVTLTKAAMNKGMSNYVYVVYSTGFGTTFILLPATFIYYRKRGCRPLTASIICRIFFLALIGSCLQICSFAGIRYSSPVLGAVIADLTPAFAFILAIISR
ncbi:hypothetical protein Patl1_16196 [Pistacia atlantica]|uniref:Uncharacterized protein n=1 Tax=Pistacia atlantica TaxID=434234 RepID=A0ACC1BAZ3_9ROSI|nr:hypothetical protein Patl1_16196 [Pistacia atlantica]